MSTEYSTDGMNVVILGFRTVVIGGAITIVGDEVIVYDEARRKEIWVKKDGAVVSVIGLD